MRHVTLCCWVAALVACSETGIAIEVTSTEDLDGQIDRLRFVVGRELPAVPNRIATFVDRSPGTDIDVNGRRLSIDPYEIVLKPTSSEHMSDAIVVAVFGLDEGGGVVGWAATDMLLEFTEDSTPGHRLVLRSGGDLPRPCEAANLGGRLVQIGVAPDADCDGYEGDDCDDLNGTAYPGAHETCGDGADNDCDGVADDIADDDLDTVTNCDGDCNDLRDDIFPGASESCDAADNNCDGDCDGEFDADRDYYTVCGSVTSADRTFCVGPRNPDTIDCDDDDPMIRPAGIERCDGIDNDCSGGCDDEPSLDPDGDGYTECGSYQGLGLCGLHAVDVDCAVDNGARHPASIERCNGIDDNCDGTRLQSALCLTMGSTDCEVGTRTCNDTGSPGWTGSCAITTGPLLPAAACSAYDACVVSAPADPIQCLVAAAPTRLRCTAYYSHASRQVCAMALAALPARTGTTCVYRVLGGTTQASYTVGLAASVADVIVGDTITDCTTAFAVSAAATNPPRDDRFLISVSVDGAAYELVGVELASAPVDTCPSQGLVCTQL